MLADLHLSSWCYSLATLLAMYVSPVRASVAYISNCCNNSSTVNVFNAANGRQTAQWIVGNSAFAAVFSPDGSKACVSNDVSNSGTVVRVASGKILATIRLVTAYSGWLLLAMAVSCLRSLTATHMRVTSSQLTLLPTR